MTLSNSWRKLKRSLVSQRELTLKNCMTPPMGVVDPLGRMATTMNYFKSLRMIHPRIRDKTVLVSEKEI
ncbi:hypothetical protein CE139_21090 [Pseudomonas oryzihabitans]|uniref:Uncharacterized protein n=1 Tax=Pseudomonas oryzihabitans TaxID=47885 RepID=A0A2Z5ABE4_9PSED|nr:hypothetical protein CE139_21090 [Pseudomonas oryzihabitans]